MRSLRKSNTLDEKQQGKETKNFEKKTRLLCNGLRGNAHTEMREDRCIKTEKDAKLLHKFEPLHFFFFFEFEYCLHLMKIEACVACDCDCLH